MLKAESKGSDGGRCSQTNHGDLISDYFNIRLSEMLESNDAC
jgi:hypothetical protein